MKQTDLELISKIAAFEASRDMSEFRNGWRYHHVKIKGSILSNLVIKGYVDIVSQSSTHTGYRLSELGRLILKDIADEVKKKTESIIQMLDLDERIFSDIIGHRDEKELLVACLLAEKPVHVLLAGPPALAKSIFLWDIERVAGGQAMWLIGSGTSKAGLWDAVADQQPQILLIDELDKMNAADTAALLSMMEGG
ncbi:MAG: AAA family ATPase, partial [Dehalococcoidales bacterium]|nr:AAA family ATPase [Dehalococcoidales bacterium]